ncbi:MAG TPA: tail fiber protein [Actinomycetota bacterium]|nr:tail fiber protein [Actinomycetota bacterium]
MAQPYVGEIRMFGGNFAPSGWAFCDGQLLAIAENETLFQLIGTTYGGDGEETFALPNLQSRTPIHQGSGFVLAEMAGVEEVTLTTQQIPVHSHPLLGSLTLSSALDPAANLTSQAPKRYFSPPPASPAAMSPQSVAPVGGSQPHDNMQPYLCISFIISLFGLFPSPT